jgi:pimeloyl-ACP methyl ester carboxylesterase
MNQCFSCDHTVYPPLRFQVEGDFVKEHRHKIWVEKYGSGSPAVILINGGGETTRQWNNNIKTIAQYTTVIAYDRTGLGLSDTTNYQVSTAKDVVSRLKYILNKLQVNPPYVLVAHSIGGLYLSYFARKYPHEIAGLVTVDTNNQFQVNLYRANIKGIKGVTHQDIVNAMNHPTHLVFVSKQAKQFLAKKHLNKHEHAKLVEDLEVMGKPNSAKQIEMLGKLPNVPLIALTEGKNEPLWHSTIKQFAKLVPCSLYYFVPHSSHHIMIDQPNVVNTAIKLVVRAAREHKILCKASLPIKQLLTV